MRAVIIATDHYIPLEPLTRRRPSALIRVGDKPILFHIIEFLAAQGWRRFDILLHEFPNLIRSKLQDGKRWGVDITYQLVKDPEHPYHLLNSIAGGWVSDDKVLLGQGSLLPLIRFSDCPAPKERPSLLMSEDGTWLGWGLFLATHLSHLSPRVTLTTLQKEIPHEVTPLPNSLLLSVKNFKDILDANHRFLKGNLPGVTPPASTKKVEEGIWIGAGAEIHATASVKKPAFIGRNTHIKEHAQIGPNVVVESNCIIDAQSKVENALICQHSYLGGDLEIKNSIVDRQWVINLTHDTQVRIHDDFILCDLTASPLKQRGFLLLERLVGGVTLLFFLPLLLIVRPFCHLVCREFIQLPSSHEPHLWKSSTWRQLRPRGDRATRFFPRWLQNLPNLYHLFLGRTHLMGLTPRTREEVQNLPSDWRTLYLSGKVGFFTLKDLSSSSEPSQDEIYASEVLYTAQMSPLFDLKTVFKILTSKILSK